MKDSESEQGRCTHCGRYIVRREGATEGPEYVHWLTRSPYCDDGTDRWCWPESGTETIPRS